MSEVTNKPKKRVKTNPNKVNQYTGPDPRQALFLEYYYSPLSKTFGNAMASGQLAGFSRASCVTLSSPSRAPAWFLEKKLFEMKSIEKMLAKAKRNIDMILDIDHTDTMTLGRGKNKKEIKVINTKVLSTKSDMTKFVAERVGDEIFGRKDKNTGTNLAIQINNNLQTDKQEYQ